MFLIKQLNTVLKAEYGAAAGVAVEYGTACGDGTAAEYGAVGDTAAEYGAAADVDTKVRAAAFSECLLTEHNAHESRDF